MATRNKPFDKMTPYCQRSVRFHALTLYLDKQDRLRILVSGKNTYALDNVATLALANLLRIFYDDIAQEAMPYTGPKDAGRKDEW